MDGDSSTRDLQAAIRTTIRSLALKVHSQSSVPVDLSPAALIPTGLLEPSSPPVAAPAAIPQATTAQPEDRVRASSDAEDDEAQFLGLFSDSDSDYFSDFDSDSSAFASKRPKRSAKKAGRRAKKQPLKKPKRTLVIADDASASPATQPLAFLDAFKRNDLLSVDAWCLRWKALGPIRCVTLFELFLSTVQLFHLLLLRVGLVLPLSCLSYWIPSVACLPSGAFTTVHCSIVVLCVCESCAPAARPVVCGLGT